MIILGFVGRIFYQVFTIVVVESYCTPLNVDICYLTSNNNAHINLSMLSSVPLSTARWVENIRGCYPKFYPKGGGFDLS